MSVADKFKAGMQTSYGYLGANDTLLSNFDYRALTQNVDVVNAADDAADIANNRYFVSVPLICNVLTGCEKMLPACMMPQIRQQLTVDLLNIFAVTASITPFYIYNIQLTNQLIDFGSEVEKW